MHSSRPQTGPLCSTAYRAARKPTGGESTCGNLSPVCLVSAGPKTIERTQKPQPSWRLQCTWSMSSVINITYYTQRRRLASNHYAVLFTDKTKLLSRYNIKGTFLLVEGSRHTVIHYHRSYLMPFLLLTRVCLFSLERTCTDTDTEFHVSDPLVCIITAQTHSNQQT